MQSSRKLRSGFTLVELLTVMVITLILIGLAVPALKAIKGSGDVTSASYEISGLIENARGYAMANNTYVWVGFYEENSATQTGTATKPPYPGKGQVAMAAVYAKDGTTSCQSNAASPANPVAMTAALILPLGKLSKIQNIHLTDVGAPSGATDINTLDGRPGLAYTYGSPDDHYNRISSDSNDTTVFPFVAQGYTFYKTIQFSPRGEVTVNSTTVLRPLVEIGLVPTHGTLPDTASKNVVAVQTTGVAGNVKIYRR